MIPRFVSCSCLNCLFRLGASLIDNTKIEIIWYYATHTTIYFKVVVYGLDACESQNPALTRVLGQKNHFWILLRFDERKIVLMNG